MAQLVQNMIRCCECDEEFKSTEDVKIHLMMAHLNNWTPYKCEKCPAMRLATIQALKIHQKSSHPEWKDKTVVYYYNDEKEEELSDMFARSLQIQCVQEDAVPLMLRSTSQTVPLFPLPSLNEIKDVANIAETSKLNAEVKTDPAVEQAKTPEEKSDVFEDVSDTEENENLAISAISVESDLDQQMSDSGDSVEHIDSDERRVQPQQGLVSEMATSSNVDQMETDNQKDRNQRNLEPQQRTNSGVEFIESFTLEDSVEWLPPEEEESDASAKMPSLVAESQGTVSANDVPTSSKAPKKRISEQIHQEMRSPKRRKNTTPHKIPKDLPLPTPPSASRQTEKIRDVVSIIMSKMGVETSPGPGNLQSSRPFVFGSSGFCFNRDGGMSKWWHGYEYHFHTPKPMECTIWKWRCSQPRPVKCCGTLHTNFGGVGKETVTIEHNHEPDPETLQAKLAVEDMKAEVVISAQKRLSQIVDDVSLGLTEEQTARLPNRPTLLRTLRRVRCAHDPNSQPDEDDIEAKLAVRDMKEEAIRTQKNSKRIIADVSAKLSEEQKRRLSSDSALQNMLRRARKKALDSASLT